jgi:hypothetical protein
MARPNAQSFETQNSRVNPVKTSEDCVLDTRLFCPQHTLLFGTFEQNATSVALLAGP